MSKTGEKAQRQPDSPKAAAQDWIADYIEQVQQVHFLIKFYLVKNLCVEIWISLLRWKFTT